MMWYLPLVSFLLLDLFLSHYKLFTILVHASQFLFVAASFQITDIIMLYYFKNLPLPRNIFKILSIICRFVGSTLYIYICLKYLSGVNGVSGPDYFAIKFMCFLAKHKHESVDFLLIQTEINSHRRTPIILDPIDYI